MKKNAFIRFITVTHAITSHNTSVSPYDWLFEIGYWKAYVTCLMGVAFKNLAMKSDFSRMRLSRSGFDCERINADRIDRIVDYERSHYLPPVMHVCRKVAVLLCGCTAVIYLLTDSVLFITHFSISIYRLNKTSVLNTEH